MSPDIAAAASPIINMELTATAAATATATNSASAIAALRSHFPLHYPPAAPPPPPGPGQTVLPSSLPPSIYANNNGAMIYGGSDGNAMVTPIMYSSALHAAHAASYLNPLPSLPPSPLSPNDPHGIQHTHPHTLTHPHPPSHPHPQPHHEHHHLPHHPFSNAYLKIIQTANDCNHLYNGAGTLTPLINGNFMTPPTLTPPTTITKIVNSQAAAATAKTTMLTMTATTTTTTSTITTSTNIITATTTSPSTISLHSHKATATVTATLTPTSASRKNLVQTTQLNEQVNNKGMNNMNNDSIMIGTYTKGTHLYSGLGKGMTVMENHTDLEYNGSMLQGYFKIPNGRESSGKQRLIKSQPNNQEANDVNRTATTMRTCNSTGSFKKGAYIELSNGSLRRVEDMRTEDFIQCAERSPHHRLIESTVVKIDSSSLTIAPQQQQSNTVVITFSYDRNRSKADIEVSPEHPFFVYGQGWASYNPDITMAVYNLKCQRLQVGDICISLTKREMVQHNSEQPQQQQTTTRYIGNNHHQHHHPYGMTIMPPRASDSSYYLNSVTANTINLSSNPSIGYVDKIKMLYQYPYTKDLQFTIHEHVRDIEQLRGHTFYHNHMVQLQSQLPQPEAIQQILRHNNNQQPLIDNNRYLYLPEQEQPLDVSISRKRRWSAPEHTLSNNNNDLEETNEPPSVIGRKKISSSTPATALPTNDR